MTVLTPRLVRRERPLPSAVKAAVTRWRGLRLDLIVLAGLAVLTFVVCLIVHAIWFPRLSGDNDDAVYVFQAKMLLDGHLTLPAAAHGDFLRPWLTINHDGQLHTAFLPAWPLMLAAAQVAFGSMIVAPALAAAAWVVATFALAQQLFGRPRLSLLAAGFVALSPLTLMHGALYLTYVFSAALLTGAAALLLRGTRRSLFIGGALFGIGLLARPVDALLVAMPCAGYALWRRRRVGSFALWTGLGVAPFALLLLLYNWHVSGSPLRPPLDDGSPSVNRFGFGVRQMLPDHPGINYTPEDAVHALGNDLARVPAFLFGGVVLISLAAAGLMVRGRRPQRLVLLTMTAAFPATYFFWFGSEAIRATPDMGVGPHYYLPAFGFVAILAANGLTRLLLRWRPALVVGLAAAAAVTSYSLPTMLRERQRLNDYYAYVQSLVPATLPGPAVALVSGHYPSRYVLNPYGFLSNPPDLRAKLLFGADLGARNNRAHDEYPGRRIYLLSYGDPGDGSTGSFVEQNVYRGRALTVTVNAPRVGKDEITPYLRVNGKTTFGKGAWTLSTEAGSGVRLPAGEADYELIVGVSLGGSRNPDAERWECRQSLGVRANGELALQTPGQRWRLIVGARKAASEQVAAEILTTGSVTSRPGTRPDVTVTTLSGDAM